MYRTASGNVLPYAKQANEGLFCVKDYCNHGHIGSYTLITPQGKLYFAQLDVYKRQTAAKAADELLTLRGVRASFVLFKHDTGAVSYTHLDVYKRQADDTAGCRDNDKGTAVTDGLDQRVYLKRQI